MSLFTCLLSCFSFSLSSYPFVFFGANIQSSPSNSLNMSRYAATTFSPPFDSVTDVRQVSLSHPLPPSSHHSSSSSLVLFYLSIYLSLLLLSEDHLQSHIHQQPNPSQSPPRRFTGILSSLLPYGLSSSLPSPSSILSIHLLHRHDSIASQLQDYLLVCQSTLLYNNHLIKALTGKHSLLRFI